MKARDLVGKTVKRVGQTRWTVKDGAHDDHYALNAIEFTDGSLLRFRVNETENLAYTVEGVFYKGAEGVRERARRKASKRRLTSDV
jgi:hypothetical protein